MSSFSDRFVGSLEKADFWKRLGKVSFTVFIVSLLAVFSQYSGSVRVWDAKALEFCSLLTAHQFCQKLLIVGIKDSDLGTRFGGVRSLSPSAIVDTVIEIARLKPAVLVVDFDTSADEYAKEWEDRAHACRDAGILDETAIIWAVVPDTSEDLFDRYLSDTSTLPDSRSELRGRVRGYDPFGSQAGSEKDPPRWAVGGFYPDPDFVVRRVPVAFSKNPSLPAAAYDAYRSGEALEEDSIDINYSIPIKRLTLSEALSHKPEDIKGSIVFLGGFYRNANDTHLTPIGPMAGVEVLARATASAFPEHRILRLNELLAFIIECSVGIASGAVCLLFPKRYVPIVVAVASLPITFIVSVFWFNWFQTWISVVPSVIGAVIHVFYERGQESVRLINELRSE